LHAAILASTLQQRTPQRVPNLLQRMRGRLKGLLTDAELLMLVEGWWLQKAAGAVKR